MSKTRNYSIFQNQKIYTNEYCRSLIHGDLSGFYNFIRNHRQYIVFYGKEKPSKHSIFYAKDLGEKTEKAVEEYFLQLHPDESVRWISGS